MLAACAGCDPNLFHDRACQTAVLACCAVCPVAEACLFTALVYEQCDCYRFGVWGATTASERVEIAGWLARRGLSVTELAACEEC